MAGRSTRSAAVPVPVSELLERLEAERRAEGVMVFGPALRIAFPTAGAPRQVAHGLGTVPDGFFVMRHNDAVFEIAWDTWTADVAVLRADVANTTAVGRFYTWAVPTPETAA